MYQADALARRAYLGLDVQPSAPGAASLSIRAVAGPGPAARAGVRPGDRLIAVGDRPVHDLEGLVAVTRTLEPGRSIALAVERAGEVLNLAANPTPLPTESFAAGEVRLDHVRAG